MSSNLIATKHNFHLTSAPTKHLEMLQTRLFFLIHEELEKGTLLTSHLQGFRKIATVGFCRILVTSEAINKSFLQKMIR